MATLSSRMLSALLVMTGDPQYIEVLSLVRENDDDPIPTRDPNDLSTRTPDR